MPAAPAVKRARFDTWTFMTTTPTILVVQRRILSRLLSIKARHGRRVRHEGDYHEG